MADRPGRPPRDLVALLGAGLVSQTGDWLLTAALVFEAYRLTGSTTVTGLTALASLVPQVCLGGVGGMLADRWDRRRTMIVVNVVAAGCLLPLLAVHGPGTVWIVYLVAAVEAVLAQLFVPAEASLVPTLAGGAQDLARANGWNGQVRNASRLVGSACGGLLAGLGGLSAVALVDSASYLVAAAVLVTIRAGRRRPRTLAELSAGPPAVLPVAAPSAAAGSAGQVWHVPVLRALVAFTVVTYVGQGVMSTLFAPFVSDVLHADGTVYGVVLAAQAIGGIVGGGLAGRVVARVGTWQTFAVGAVLFGLGDLVLFLYPLLLPRAWPAIVLMIVVGVPGALTVAALTTLLQRNSPPGRVGRTFGAVAAAQGLGEFVGIGLATSITPLVGIVPVIAVQGLGYLLGGAVMVCWRRTAAGSASVPTSWSDAGEGVSPRYPAREARRRSGSDVRARRAASRPASRSRDGVQRPSCPPWPPSTVSRRRGKRGRSVRG